MAGHAKLKAGEKMGGGAGKVVFVRERESASEGRYHLVSRGRETDP